MAATAPSRPTAHLPGQHDQSSHGRKKAGQPTLGEAQSRQADIDTARKVGAAAADVDEWVANAAGVADPPVRLALRRLADRHERAGSLDPATAGAWREMADAGDLDGLRASAVEVAVRAGLSPVGRAGEVTAFDATQHQAIAGAISPGAAVEVVRQGHTYLRYGEMVQLARAVVEPTAARARFHGYVRACRERWNRADHRQLHEGDHGVRWTARDGMEFPGWAMVRDDEDG